MARIKMDFDWFDFLVIQVSLIVYSSVHASRDISVLYDTLT